MLLLLSTEVCTSQGLHMHAPVTTVERGSLKTRLDGGPSGVQKSDDRPLIFGSGYIYPAWKGLSGASAVKWEEASLDAIRGMGGTLTGASFNWCDIERTRGT